jgi:ABC-type sugar transport system ATPase subunit
MEEKSVGVSAALRFEHVSKTFVRANGDRETVLDDFSLDIAPGELVAVVGSSGIGKSTILHLAAGLEKPDSGRVQFAGGGRPRLGMVFQQPRLFDWLTVADNIAVAVKRRAATSPRRAPCWPRLAWRGTRAPTRWRCRAGSGSAWPWRAPSPLSPMRSCWTNHSARSMR